MCQPLAQKMDICTQKKTTSSENQNNLEIQYNNFCEQTGLLHLPVADSNSPRLASTLLIMTETPSLEKAGPTMSPHPLYPQPGPTTGLGAGSFSG